MKSSKKPIKKPTTKKTSRNVTVVKKVAPKIGGLYWIGIGASAGGLEALRELVAHIPRSNLPSEVTYIVAQHLSPKHRSMLVELVGRETSIKVQELADGTVPEPNVMYITPPSSDVYVKEGALHLSTPQSEFSPKPSVDYFFTTLAEEIGDFSIGVILSGTGSDGAHGIRAIRAAGGITIAQEPTSAKYDGMPSKAIDTGCVDFILTPDRILAEISKVLRSPASLELLKDNDAEHSGIVELLQRLKERCGVDFKDYKTGTLYRRINRRMKNCNTDNLHDYLDLIDRNPKELDALYKDILISVTNFFRDSESFKVAGEMIKDIIQTKPKQAAVRIWVPGCATGEEAYSLAILIAEACGGVMRLNELKLQVFATDIDMDALARARKGVYPAELVKNISDDLRMKYFRAREHSYEIIKPIRDMVLFSKHNVFADPPFQRLDLIACRNMLIYFNPVLQQKVFSHFHYALNHHGVLFLGKSEALGNANNLFQAVDNKHKIYRRKIMSGAEQERRSLNTSYSAAPRIPTQSPVVQPKLVPSTQDFPDAVIAALSPDSLLIDEEMNVLRIYGDVQAYTQLTSGSASMNLMSLARKEFRQELRAIIYKSLREGMTYHVLPKKLEIMGKVSDVNIVIRPLTIKNAAEKLLLVSFEKIKQAQRVANGKKEGKNNPVIAELEQELAATREHLQTVVEELETSNEELQSTNEELQSSNEELQSSNEELSTANEEMQSSNEELITINEELQVKSSELSMLTEDLTNIKDSIDFPLVVVNKSLMVKHYNQAANEIFAFEDDSIGQALQSVPTRIDIPNLRHSVISVINKGKILSQQHESNDRCYVERIIPYRDSDGRIEGAVITFHDNTDELRLQRILQESEERYRLIVDGVKDCAIYLLDPVGNIKSWNKTAERIKGYAEKEVIGRNFSTFFTDEDRARDVPEEIIACASKDGRYECNAQRVRKNGSMFWGNMLLNAIHGPQGQLIGFVEITRDITERRKSEAIQAQLRDIAIEVAEAHSIEETIESSLRRICHFLGFTVAHAYMWNDHLSRLESSRIWCFNADATLYSEIRQASEAMVFQAGEGIVGKVYDAKKAMFFNDAIGNSASPRADMLAKLQLHSGMAMPIMTSGRVSVVLEFFRTAKIREDKEMLEFCDMVSLPLSRVLERKHLEQSREHLVDKLTESNTELERFAYVASHDMQEPLRMVASFSKMIQDEYGDRLDAQGKEYIHLVTDSAKRMQEMVTDLLEYARVGNDTTSFKPIDSNDTVARVLEMLSDIMKECDAEVTYDALPDIAGNPVQFMRVLQNLISNALKYQPQGRIPKIHIGAFDAGSHWRFSVQDNGIGIDEAFVAHIFEPFRRLHSWGEYKGSGIGLAVCNKIVENHGGKIWVTSKVGEGSIFYFTIRKQVEVTNEIRQSA